jgi:hypothetical protein
MKLLRFSPVSFMIAFCCAYAAVFALNWPLFYYYPLHGDFSLGPKALQGIGPAMAWYGLMTSAGAIALLLSICIPDRAIEKLFRGGFLWFFPCAAMVACAFLLRHLFV